MGKGERKEIEQGRKEDGGKETEKGNTGEGGKKDGGGKEELKG